MEWVKLGDVATYVNGYAFKPADWLDEGKPIIRIQNLTNSNSKYNYTNLEIDPKYNVIKGDVLISWSATLDVFEWEKEDAYLNQHIFKVVFDKRDIDKDYFKYIVKNAIYSSVKLAHGSTMKHLTKTNFENIKIPIYDTETEKKISKKLRLAENIISTRKDQIAALDELVQSVFYEMFGDYCNLSSNLFSTKIKDIAEVKSGATPRTSVPDYWDGDILWVTPAEINEEEIYLYDTNRKITEAGVESAALKVIPENSVLLSSRAPIGKVAINKKRLYTNQGFKSIVPREDYIIPIYLYFLLYFNTEYLNSLGNGATFKEISKKVVENIQIPLPPLELQEQFAAKVEAIEVQKAKLQTSLEEMETLFDALMQEAFSGNLG